MKQERALTKVFSTDTGGTHQPEPFEPFVSASEELWADNSQSDLYTETRPAMHKKHSLNFINQRRKVRYLAEDRLISLSTQLMKLANEVRYYDPLMAEALDDAWDATEAAIGMMQNED